MSQADFGFTGHTSDRQDTPAVRVDLGSADGASSSCFLGDPLSYGTAEPADAEMHPRIAPAASAGVPPVSHGGVIAHADFNDGVDWA